MDNPIFKLILVEEIKRMTYNVTIKALYSSMRPNELGLQLICADATLSRGTLPLVEKLLIKKNASKEEILKKLDELSKYDFYFSSESIYKFLCKNIDANNIKDEDILSELRREALSGELDELVENANI